MVDRLYFGIGCFHFGIQETADRKFDGERYIQEIQAALEAIPSIDNISLRGDPDLLILEWEVHEPPPPMSQGQGHFPDFTGSTSVDLQVEFDIRIPYRVQCDLLDIESSLLATYTERFRVVYHYSYFGPVVFVIPLEPEGESSPSDAVRLVRDFLKEEFRRSDSKFIRLETLGPSPFHTDCIVKPHTSADPDSSQRGGWDCMERLSTGYSDTIFSYDPNAFLNAEEAFRAIARDISSELGLFYLLRRTEDSKRHVWIGIEEITETLTEMQSQKGLRGRLRRSFGSAKPTTEGLFRLAQYESAEIIHKTTVQHDYSDVYSTDRPPCFRRHIDDLMRESFVAPIGPALRILQLAEARHVKRIDTFALLVSSILGGAIGPS